MEWVSSNHFCSVYSDTLTSSHLSRMKNTDPPLLLTYNHSCSVQTNLPSSLRLFTPKPLLVRTHIRFSFHSLILLNPFLFVFPPPTFVTLNYILPTRVFRGSVHLNCNLSSLRKKKRKFSLHLFSPSYFGALKHPVFLRVVIIVIIRFWTGQEGKRKGLKINVKKICSQVCQDRKGFNWVWLISCPDLVVPKVLS